MGASDWAVRSRLSETPMWALPVEQVERVLGTTADGLSPLDAKRRLKSYGANLLRERRPRRWWSILAAQFRSMIVGLLALAALASFFFERRLEAVAVVAVIGLNAAIGFAMELRATRSMEALRRLGQASATVRRAGKLLRVPARDLVPGDLLVVEAGDLVTTDARIREANKLEANESTLTGESVPVEKHTRALPGATRVAERHNMLFKGTIVTRGSGEALVVATGMDSELGRISALLEEARDEETPLEKRLGVLARRLLWLTLAIALGIVASGLAVRRELWLVVETAIALAVATVPEGLPIVATLALARGMRRMARHNALVRRLSAVETLGATAVILTDKTGTLTENTLSVERVLTEAGEHVIGDRARTVPTFAEQAHPYDAPSAALLRRALLAGVLCNNAELRGDAASAGVGDPLEVALLEAGASVGLHAGELALRLPEIHEEAFDPETRVMATHHREGDGVFIAVKGAPEAVVGACSTLATRAGVSPLSAAERAGWLSRSEQMAASGLRVLALAEGRSSRASERPRAELTLLGLAALHDPPRSDVGAVIAACRAAGVRVIMATGDQAATARAVAAAIGLAPPDVAVLLGREVPPVTAPLADEAVRAILEADVFARTSPQEKLALIRLHQRAGAVVAMVGDGVNDAPALRTADIGVAMGRRGTEVAKEAADIVLVDDSLGTVAFAIEQGRVIFGNIRKFVVYLLSCNVSELLAVGVASLSGVPLPLLPLQILFLNLVTDVFPALALGACDAETGVMQRPARASHEPVITRRHWGEIGAYGLLIAAATLGSLYFALHALGLRETRAVTVSFLTLGFAQTFHVFNMRAPRSSVVRNEVTNNIWIWVATALCVLLLLMAVYTPAFNQILNTRPPDAASWLLIAITSLLPLAAGQLALAWRRRSGATRARLALAPRLVTPRRARGSGGTGRAH